MQAVQGLPSDSLEYTMRFLGNPDNHQQEGHFPNPQTPGSSSNASRPTVKEEPQDTPTSNGALDSSRVRVKREIEDHFRVLFCRVLKA